MAGLYNTQVKMTLGFSDYPTCSQPTSWTLQAAMEMVFVLGTRDCKCRCMGVGRSWWYHKREKPTTWVSRDTSLQPGWAAPLSYSPCWFQVTMDHALPDLCFVKGGRNLNFDVKFPDVTVLVLNPSF